MFTFRMGGDLAFRRKAFSFQDLLCYQSEMRTFALGPARWPTKTVIRLLCTALIAILLGAMLAGILFWTNEPDHRPHSAHAGAECVGDIRLTSEPARVGKSFLVTAHINGHVAGEEVTLTLPGHVYQADFENLVREIPPVPPNRKYAEVTWSLRAYRPGRYVLSADCPAIGTAYTLVPVQD
jgi:hypothetical protein